MAKVKNKRLSQRDRDVITRFAKKQITETEDATARDAAYELAANAVAVAVEEKYPKRDMKVLARYEMASEDRCLYVSNGGNGDYDRFEFAEGDKRIPVRPDRYCRRQPIMLEGEAGEAFTAFQKAEAAYKDAIKSRTKDFTALVFNTTTFNALADVWPAVEALRGEIVGNSAALSVLSDDVVKRIKADPALMADAA